MKNGPVLKDEFRNSETKILHTEAEVESIHLFIILKYNINTGRTETYNFPKFFCSN